MAYFTFPLGQLWPREFALIDRPHRVPVTYDGRQICEATLDLDSGNCQFEDVGSDVYENLMLFNLKVEPIFDRGSTVQLLELRLTQADQSEQ